MSGKKKTTFAKMARERKLQERRLEKQAKKEARKLAGNLEPAEFSQGAVGDDDEPRASLDPADALSQRPA